MNAFADSFFSKEIRLLIVRDTHMAANPGNGDRVVRGIKEEFFNFKNVWDQRGDKIDGLVNCLKDAK